MCVKQKMSKETPRESPNSFSKTPAVTGSSVHPASEWADGNASPDRFQLRRLTHRWWMYVVALSFLSLHLVEAFLVVWGPAYPEGMVSVFEDGAMVVRSVGSGTMFEREGLQAGDRVLTVSGLPIRSPRDWAAVLANVQAGGGEVWDVLRNGDRIQLKVAFERASWRNRFDNGVLEYL